MGELYNPIPKLPKNIRQIGERDQIVKLYVEDYVNTYLNRLYPTGGQDLRVGLLLGNVEMQDGTPYIFIDGAIEMEGITESGEKIAFTEAAWKKVYQEIEQTFPKRTVQGWFLCGASGSQLSPLNYWKQHVQYFPGKNQLMYLNSGLECEESVYITSEDGFYKLQGYSIYYERNQMMQDYMVLRKDAKRVESGVNDKVIHDFRQRLDNRKSEAVMKNNTVGLLSRLCSVMMLIILAGGIVMLNNYSKMREMESVIASVMPIISDSEENIMEAETNGSKLIIEEAPGTVETVQNITGDSIEPEENEAKMQTDAESKAQSQTQPEIKQETQQQETQQSEAQENQGSEENKEASVQLQRYTVKEGETLYGICIRRYSSIKYVEEICRLNNLDNADKIMAGQSLIMP